MDPTVNEWLTTIFRWIHVVAGIAWIGHLYFFNFVNAQLAKTYTPESRKAVLPELMPRALYWFRWGALYTWVTGVLLLGLAYYMGGVLVETDARVSNGLGSGISLALILVVFFVYDVLWKSPLGKNEKAAAAVSFAGIVALLFGLRELGFTGRAVWIHLGALFGTIMMMNVWMRIWPAQRKIINAVKGLAPAADPSVPALAGLRSKHNTYMSVPLVLSMMNYHYPTLVGYPFGYAVAILVGWGAVWMMYRKAASPAPGLVPAPQAAEPVKAA